MKKIVSLLVVFAVLVSLGILLCSCTGGATVETTLASTDKIDEATTTTTASKIEPSEKENDGAVTLTLLIRNFDQALGGELGISIADDPVMQEIQRQTGITLQLEASIVDLSDLEQKIASQELCDLNYISAQPEYEDPAIFYPLDVLAEETNSNFFRLTTAMEQIANQAEDGHIYTIRNGFTGEMVDDCINEQIPMVQHDFSPVVMSVSSVDVPFRPLVYRADILDKMEATAPESIEALEKLLYEVKERQAELEITDVFSFCSFFHHPLAEYMGVKQEVYFDKDQGKVVYPWRNEAWIDYFKLMRRWHQDGILTLKAGQDMFYNIFSEIETLKNCFMTYPTLRMENGSINEEMRKLGIGGRYDGQSPVFVPFDKVLTYENEVQLTVTEYGIGEYGCFIAANSLHADRALQLMTFLKSSEGDKLTRWGLENIHYEQTEDGRLQYKENWITTAQGGVAPKEWGLGSWALMGSSETEAVLRASRELNTTDEDLATDFRLERESCLTVEKEAEKLYNPAMAKAKPSDGSELAEKARQLELMFYQYGDSMIQASSEEDLEKLWDELMDKLAQNGLDQVEQAVTEAYASELKRYHEEGLLTQYPMPEV